jgi:catechol 2,3-dioxygenase-like lactoylglutathione lyase family enzyme
VVWILAEQLWPVLQRIETNGGRVRGRPEPDGAARYLVECDDPARELGNGVVLWFGETADFDGAVARAAALGATVVLPPSRNPSEGDGNGPSHREIWLEDPDGYTVVVASSDGEAFEPSSTGAEAP